MVVNHAIKDPWAILFKRDTINSAIYLDMLTEFLQPQLEQDGILDTVIYQRDCAPGHYAIVAREYSQNICRSG